MADVQYEVYQPEQLYQFMENFLVANPHPQGAWNLNIGSSIRTMLEAFAIVSGMTVHDFYINLVDAIFNSVMNSFDFTKLSGYPASGYLVFKRDVDAATVTIPAGTRIIADNGVIFETLYDGSITVGNLESSAVISQATTNGTLGNIIINDIDTLNGKGDFVDRIDGVDNVINETAFSGGQDEETDEEQLARFRDGILGLTKTTVNGLKRATLSVTGVKSASVLENYPNYGTNTIFADDGTGSLSSDVKTAIEELIEGDTGDPDSGYRAAGIEIIVSAPQITAISANITVFRLPSKSITDDTMITLVQSAIEQYINSRRLNEDVVLSKIKQQALDAHNEVWDVKINSTTPDSETNTQGAEVISVTGYYIARTGGSTGGSINVSIIDTVDN